MSEFENEGHEIPPQTPIDRLFSDLYDNGEDDEALPYDSIVLAVHSYLEEEVRLTTGQASTVVKGMIESGAIPSTYHFEADRSEAFARLKVGLYTDIIPLYASLYDADSFKSWLPGMMDVIFSAHNYEDEDVSCMEMEGYDTSHCDKGYCPVRTVCYKIIAGMQEPDLTSYDYQYFPEKTVSANIALLDYLTKEKYIPRRTGSLLYHYYRHLTGGSLVDFFIDQPEEEA